MTGNNKFVILDGHSLAYRAFYALPLLQNTRGQYTNAVYGFANMLFRLIEEEEPAYIVCAFDLPAPTFRHKVYSEYKGHREKAPNEFKEQIPLIKEILKAMNIITLEIEGYEADDIIGTCCDKATAQGIESLVVTGDADAFQLVSDKVKIAMTRKGITNIETFDSAAIEKKYELTPKQMIDFKALKGDPSDNIPGVPGVGEKTAIKLLKEYGTLEKIFENIENLQGKKLKENFTVYHDQALISKELVTICKNVPLDFNLSDSKRGKDYDLKKLRDIFTQLEFKSLLNKFPGNKEKDNKLANFLSHANGETVQIKDLQTLLNSIKPGKEIIVYFTGINEKKGMNWKDDPQGLALKVENKSYYISLSDNLFDAEEFFTTFKPVFENEEIIKITTQGKYLYGHLAAKYGIFVKGVEFDVVIAAYLIDPVRKDFSLLTLAQDFLSLSITEEQEEKLSNFAYLDLIQKLYLYLQVNIKELGMAELLYTLELPLIPVLAAMERQGIKVDGEYLKNMSRKTEEKEINIRKEIYSLVGEEFNINSPKQLRVILFEKLKLPIIKKTKTGPSTDASVLEELASQHEIVAKILIHRHLFKLRTTYLEGLLKLKSPNTDKIHTTFNQTVTATGRLSSTEPNLQNIPIRQEEGRLIRKAFVPENPSWLLLAADYSQIELRLLAHLSKDDGLCRAFLEGQDIHSRTAAEVCHVPLDEVTNAMRSQAKAINFGIIYGMSDYGLSQNLDISRQEAGEFISRYFSKYPGVKEYIDEIIKKAKEDGYVTTLFNRRRYLAEINHSNYNIRSFAERMAMNTPIQGTAADIIKKSMVETAKGLFKWNLRAKMLLQVHDELVFEVPKSELDKTAALVKDIMENVISLEVPLTVDIKYGYNWLEMSPYIK